MSFIAEKPYYVAFGFKFQYESQLNGKWHIITTIGKACVKVHPADYSSWDSDMDYYGYRELSAYEVTDIEVTDEDSNLVILKDFSNRLEDLRVFPDYKEFVEALESDIISQSYADEDCGV